MKAFDPKGEYTPAEVKSTLAGSDGTRNVSFRYELLDEKNNIIRELDNVQSCTVDNNALADIKRTAKFNILDTGSINYLKDRIKPYVRFAMPSEVTYREVVESLNPSVWWTLDDTPVPLESYAAGAAAVANGTTYSTPATAYDLTPYEVNDWSGVYTGVALGNANVRSEFWLRKTTSPAQSLEFTSSVTGSAPSSVGMEIYHSTSPTGETLTPVWSGNVRPGYTVNYSLGFPKSGYYFAKTYALTTDIITPILEITPSTRLEDSSGNGVYGSTLYLFDDKKKPGLIADGGTSVSEESYSTQWESADDSKMFSLDTGLSFNYWGKFTAKDLNYNNTGISFQNNERVYFEYDQAEGSNEVELIVSAYRDNSSGSFIWADSIVIPEPLIGGSVHMYTYTIDFATSECVIYLDGSERGRLSVPDTVLSFLKTPVTKVWWYMFGFTLMEVDDMSYYPVALKGSDVTSLYHSGISNATERSEYIEYPQGVFLLSSPTRTMVDGNTVVREVEAYDQLLVLQEDTYDTRFSVPVGTKYTDAVAGILGTLTPTELIPINEENWVRTTSADTDSEIVFLSESAIDFGPITTSDPSTPNITSLTGYVAENILYAWKNPAYNPSVNYEFGIRGYPNGITTAREIAGVYFGKSTGGTAMIFARFPGSTMYSGGTAFDAVQHAYMRIRELNGIFYIESSADNISWTLISSAKSNWPPQTNIWVLAVASAPSSVVGTVAGGVVTGIKLEATPTPSFNLTKSDKVTPTVMEWEPGTSKLRVINDLLGAINYTSATYDEDGNFTAEPYIAPSVRGAEFTYATDSESVITGDVGQTVDLFKVPNKWVLVVSDPERAPITGTYTNNDPMSPTSTVSRGRTIVDFRTEQDAADQITLDAKAARLAFEASQVYEKISFNTAIMPIHSDADVYNLVIDGLVIDNKYSETAWSMPLEAGASMKHEVRRITNV